MQVREILAVKGSEVITAKATMPATMAAQVMSARGIGAMVVSSDGVTVEGLLREREVVAEIAHRGGSLGNAKVRDLMITPVVTCAATDSLKDVMGLITSTRSRHLPVLEDGRLCGLVSVGDLVKYRLDELELECRILRDAYLASH